MSVFWGEWVCVREIVRMYDQMNKWEKREKINNLINEWMNKQKDTNKLKKIRNSVFLIFLPMHISEERT